MVIKRHILYLFVLLPLLSVAQVGASTDSLFKTEADSLLLEEIPEAPDSAFALAREYAFEAEYEKAEKILQFNVLRYPENTDYSIFLARVYGWQKEFSKSRELLYPIIKEDTAQMEAYRLMTQLERFDKKYDTSLVMSNQGLEWFPKDEFFLVNKAQSQAGLIKYEDALTTVDTALRSHPNNNELKQLRIFLLNQLIASGLSVGFGLDYFTDNVYETWYSGFVQYGVFTNVGPIIPRINIANRFGITGTQFEIDAFPQLGGGKYFYLNAGYSESSIYPRLRFGGEFFTGLPETNFEVSAGFRYLYFDVNNDAILYTVSVGAYNGNSFFQFRPFFIPQDPSIGVSYNFLYRYFLSKGGFLQATVNFGFIPDQRIIQVGGVVGEEIYTVESQTASLAFQRPLGARSYLRIDASFSNQEIASDPDNFYNIYSGFLTFGYRF